MARTHGALKSVSVIFVLSERSYRDFWNYNPWVSRGTDPEENDKRPLGSFGRVASRMNCRYRAPVPFTPLVATVLLASQSIGLRCDARKPRTTISPDSSGRDQRLDQHRFRPLGKLVVGNLDRIADVDDVGN